MSGRSLAAVLAAVVSIWSMAGAMPPPPTALAMGSTGAPGVPMAQGRPKAAANVGIPDALRRAAIATLSDDTGEIAGARSDATGEIAGARIGDTGTYVVYVRTAGVCGSGGCRAQIWRTEGGGFVQGESLPVGRLPIVVLPQALNGMPLLGVTVFDARNPRPTILSVGFDGRGYTQQSERLLPANRGRPLVTHAMLRPF